jgi:quercetin dioxygenase-like cupin family protein
VVDGSNYSKRVDSAAYERQLRQEGFRSVYVWRDAADAFYADHAHSVDTAHVILDGEMTLTCGGSTRTYSAGDRPPDVPAGTVHSARMGPSGCRYLIGEK